MAQHKTSSKRSHSFSNWFWILLTYVVAALVWWFISLEKQNTTMSTLRLQQLDASQPDYAAQVQAIQQLKKRNTTKHVSEGITFLALILVGAVFVYRSIRRQMELAALQRNFMMAITHELKTPIATTRLSIETLLRRSLDAEQQQKLLRSALAETNRLNILTNNILLASQMEEKNFQRDNKPLNLAALLKAVVADYKNRFPNRTLTVEADSDVTLQGDELLLQIAISNLIDNALKYSPKESAVHATLHRQGNRILIRVADEGPGIPDAEKERIFEKFYRGGNEITRQAKGTGLGLYLTRKIVEDHNGAIFVNDNKPQGSIFVIQF